ncbi:MAG: FomA family porin-like outer membrane protein [Cetobacterium sp.]|uniref:FomA family porin-like outer membrane protein n=1 Tax=Cetobacterium sp. TaxID=2071632 RepID=UPI003F3D8AF5
MKKLALLLGSLLVVATAVQAKEIVAAPVEVSKEIIVVAEPVVEEVAVEVVVAPEFRPTGYVGVQYKAYGNTENAGDKVSSNDEWNNGSNNYSRLETTFGVAATENFSLEGRIRDYNNLERNDEKYNNTRTGTETRLRAYYKHNDLFTSRVEYMDTTSDSQTVEYQARFNVYKNEGALLSNVVIAPKFKHEFAEDGGGNHTNTVGADIEYAGNLPLGFTWDGTVYLNQNFYGKDIQTGVNLNETKDEEFVVSWEMYLYKTIGLYSNDKYALDFNFEGGYDAYDFRQYDRYSADSKLKTEDKNTYSLYTLLTLDAEYKVTENFALNTGVGAEYRNWDNKSEGSASNWRWQPLAYAGMKVTF